MYMLSGMNQLLMAPFNCEASFFMGRYINYINHVTLGPMSSCHFWHRVSNYWYIHTCKSNSHSQLQWKYVFRCGSRIWSGGGPQLLEAKSCQRSKVELRERSEHSAAGVQGPLKGPGSFWVFDAQICILIHSRDSFSLI